MVTATSAVVAYLGVAQEPRQDFWLWFVLLGIYAFFGTLWLDSVYVQRQSGMYIFMMDEELGFLGAPFGWEHFI